MVLADRDGALAAKEAAKIVEEGGIAIGVACDVTDEESVESMGDAVLARFGRVDAVGRGVDDVAVGDRLGVPWLRATCGRCRFCAVGAENLCPDPTFTAWDADGGFAEWCTVPAAYAYRLPTAFDDE